MSDPSIHSTPSTQDLVTAETPWLGLRAFTEDVRGYFFGRDRDLADLFERVAQKPLTTLFGQSGLGKTSLLQAALIPRLRRAGFLPVLLRLDHGESAASLETQILRAVRVVVEPAVVSMPEDSAPAPLWQLLHDPALGLCREGAPRVVLLLDQFEEIFTLGEATPARRTASHAFLHVLADVVENRVSAGLRPLIEHDEALADRVDYAARPLKILLSLREDFLHRLERWRQHLPSLMDNRLELRLLTGPQALDAAVEPGKLRCATRSDLPPIVSPETGAAIVRFIADVDDDVPLAEIDAVPPLLSLLCSELNAQRGESPVIRSEQIEGRAEDILAQFYERCFAPHPPAVRWFVEDRLLSPEGFRQSANHDAFLHEMRSAGLAEEDAGRILGRLVDDRLLVSEERGGIHRIELTHDILTGMARSSRDARHAREAGEKRRRRRQRVAIVITGLAVLAAAISVPLMLWAFAEKRAAEAEKRQGEELLWEASKSDSEESLRKLAEEGDWNTAVAYGARALRIRPGNAPAACRLFGHTLLAGMAPSRILAHVGPVTHALFLPDGAALLTVTGGVTVRRWEPAAGNRWTSREIFAARKGEKILALSATGDRLCLIAPDGSARLWDVSARTVGPTLGGPKPSAAVFSSDGSRLLTISESGPVFVWDTRNADELASFSAEEPVTTALAPDGSRVLIGTKAGTIRCWKSAPAGRKWEVEWTLEDALTKGVAELTISPDGSRFASVSGDGAAACWSMPTRFQVASLKGEQAAACVAYSNDGSMVATGGSGGTVQLWERASGKPLAFLRGHRDAITALCFSGDGRFLLTASQDGTARLWEMARCPMDAAEANLGEAADSGEIPPAPGWVYESLLPFLCGKELDREGKILDLSVQRQLETQAVVEQRLETLRPESGKPAGPWDRFLAWKFLSDSRTRPISPDSTLSVPEFVERSLWKGDAITQSGGRVPPLHPGQQRRDASATFTFADEASVRAVWQAAPGHPLVQWALGKTHSGGAWGGWLRDRALRRLAEPATGALYGVDTVARWATAQAAIDALNTLPSEGFTNSLGMKFASVEVSGGKKVLFSIWETRVQDYAVYAHDQAGVDDTWKDLLFKGHKVSPTKDCPVAAVSFEDANGFCEWLTGHERALGKITASQRYRLPTDEEWSWAVGIGEEEEEALRGRTPKDKHAKVGAYPWGTLRYLPLDDNAKPLGNYADSELIKTFPELYAIPEYSDGYVTTAPVATYPAGAHGLYDMGGNVWEWCQDWFDPAEKKSRVARGASWYYYDTVYLLSSSRIFDIPDYRRFDIGFRCVLAEDFSAH
jgi:WD40 repeat protein